MLHTTPHRLVLIEDNPAYTALLRQALNEHGEPYTLQVLRDGEAAIEYVMTHCAVNSAEPCLIILDLHLPRYDGTAVLRTIRSNPTLEHVSVAVLTTAASPGERDEVLQLGVCIYRTKPMRWSETVDLARELIDICKNPKRLAAHSST